MCFREVVRPPFWLLLFIYFLFASFALSIWAALGNTPALVALFISTILLILIYFKGSLVIEVDDKELRVGSAHIELKYLGNAMILNNSQLSIIRTREADPLAFLAIRFWSTTGVKIEINDARDSTPYWLITCNKGSNLMKALGF